MKQTLTLYEILGGDLFDDKTNCLKSLVIIGIEDNRLRFENVSYKNAYHYTHFFLTFEKVYRILKQRKLTIFKAIKQQYGQEINAFSIYCEADGRPWKETLHAVAQFNEKKPDQVDYLF